MRVVIVDDDVRKQERLSDVIRTAVGNVSCEIECGASVPDGVRLLETFCDLLVLDVNLPLRGDDGPVRDGGIRLLRQINRGGPGLVRPGHILGVTAHADLIADAQAEFRQEAWELLHCDPTTDEWEQVVANKAIHVSAQSPSGRRMEYDYDLAIITALKEVEFEAVLRLPCSWLRMTASGDDTVYFRGEMERDGRKGRVIAAAAVEMGIAAATALATKMIISFRPRYLFMAGIAAGVEGNPGDILIADESWDYGSGKIATEGDGKAVFRFGAKHIQIDPGLKETVTHFCRDRRDMIAGIQNSWIGKPSTNLLQVKVGPFATGAAVIEHEATVREIRGQDRKLIGFDMEAYGVLAAARIAPEPRPKCMIAKSICDFGKPPKTDEWQSYAAHTSAWFIHAFVTECLLNNNRT
jgi:nucleoside phosphorylase